MIYRGGDDLSSAAVGPTAGPAGPALPPPQARCIPGRSFAPCPQVSGDPTDAGWAGSWWTAVVVRQERLQGQRLVTVRYDEVGAAARCRGGQGIPMGPAGLGLALGSRLCTTQGLGCKLGWM